MYKYKYINEIIQQMFGNSEIYKNLHYEYENQSYINEFWTAKRWKQIESIKNTICPGN